jgi:hypothetical protein
MTTTDMLAWYGAALSTVLGVRQLITERRRLRVSCYLAEIREAGGKLLERDIVMYSITNVGGKPIVIAALGGSLRNGRNFIFEPKTVKLPFTLQPGEFATVPGPMPDDLEQVISFIVHDGVGKEWRASPKHARKQLAGRSEVTRAAR